MSVDVQEKREVLDQVFLRWNEEGVRYAVLHGIESYPEKLGRDVDVAVDPAHLDLCGVVTQTELVKAEFSCVRFKREWGAQFLFGFRPTEDTVLSVELDLIPEIRWGLTTLLKGPDSPIMLHGFQVDPWGAFLKRVVMQVLGGNWRRFEQRPEELSVTSVELTAAFRRLGGLIPEHLLVDFLQAVRRSDLPRIKLLAPCLRGHLGIRRFYRVPCQSVSNLFKWIRDEVALNVLPCRVAPIVAVVGPDGVGKGTTIHALQRSLSSLPFTAFQLHHWRPGLLPLLGRLLNGAGNDGGGAAPVEAVQPRRIPGRFTLLRSAYYAVDFVLGYWLRDLRISTRLGMVVYDRCALDMAVDPVRYGISSPRWPRLLWRVVPKPDLIILLYDAPDRIHARKRELSVQEIRRQLSAWLRLAQNGEVDAVVTVDAPPEEIARRARDLIVDAFIAKHERGTPDGRDPVRWLDSLLSEVAETSPQRSAEEGQHEDKRTGARYVSVTLPQGRHCLLPAASRKAALSALSLYNPQSLRARLGKKLLTGGIRTGVAQRFLPRVQLRIDRLAEHLKTVLGRNDLHLAVYLGPPGPQRKPVFKLMDGAGELVGYAKAGWDETTRALVQNELRVLRELAGRSLSFQVPRVLYAGKWNGLYLCVQSGPTGKIRPAPKALTSDHGPATSDYVQAIKDLREIHYQEARLAESYFWQRLRDRVERVTHSYYRHVLEQGMAAVEKERGGEVMPFHLCHGDLTPWNTLKTNGQLYIFDWEYSEADAPAGWDAVHLLFQTGMLLRKDQPQELLANLEAQKGMESVFACDGRFDAATLGPRKTAALLYSLERLAFYAADNSSQFEKLRTYGKLIQLFTLG